MTGLASPEVVGGVPAHHSGEGNKPIQRVVIHSAVMPCEPGRARQLGAMNASGATGGSWHYATDPREAIQCSWDSFVCWHAPPNPHSLGIEMADTPGKRPATLALRRLNPWRWRGKNHRAMLAVTARLTAELLVYYELPVMFLRPKDLRAGRRGFTTHANVTRAWHQSTHWDPGWWPRRRFTRMVRTQVQHIHNDQARRNGGRA